MCKKCEECLYEKVLCIKFGICLATGRGFNDESED